MKLHVYAGTKIDFEGIDGSGKSEQLRRTREYLGSRNVVFTKEPWTLNGNGAPVESGLEIYRILQGKHPMFTIEQLGLEQFQIRYYFANRREHQACLVTPYLQEGFVVISDRGLLSVAYGAADITRLDPLMTAQALHIPDLVWPDAILLYDVPAEVAMEREYASGKILDAHENLPTLTRVRANYLAFASLGLNVHVIDSAPSAGDVWKKTKLILDGVLGQ